MPSLIENPFSKPITAPHETDPSHDADLADALLGVGAGNILKFPQKNSDGLKRDVTLTLEEKQAIIKGHEQCESFKQAAEIMGPNFFGPDALKKAFGVEVQAPPITFSIRELQEAWLRGERLILRTNTATDGSALTMKKMYEYCQNAFKNKGKILRDVGWYKDEPFYTQDTCRVEWALVSDETIPGSENKNYIQQTERIIEHLKDTVYRSRNLPKKYKEAIEEFESEKSSMETLMQSNWQQAAEKLASLHITQFTRQTAQEAFFDMLTVFLNTNNERMLEKMYTWTSSRDSDDGLVRVGSFGVDGVRVSGNGPFRAFSELGVLLSRTQ